MRLSKAILTAEDLPGIGSKETPMLEFKPKLGLAQGKNDPEIAFKGAQDIGAMASAYGGTIIIGTSKGGDRLRGFEPMDREEKELTTRLFEQAALHRCQPSVPVHVAEISHGEGWVVAVNVEAILNQPIGVKVRDKLKPDGWGGDAWVFHARLSTHVTEIKPRDLPMFMNASVRRVALLLEGIPEKSREKVTVWWNDFTWDSEHNVRRHKAKGDPLVLRSVSIAENSVTFQRGEGGLLRFPLEDVRAVWQSSGRDGEEGAAWSVRVAGKVVLSTTETRYEPPAGGESWGG